MPTVAEIRRASVDFFEMTLDASFSKSLQLNKAGERRLLPIYGAFLAGRFGDVEREIEGRKRDGIGRIDFCIGGVALELAVRKPKDSRTTLSTTVNTDEVHKLLWYDGTAVLVLLDYSRSPFEEANLNAFRSWPSLGKGNRNLTPFNVVYCYRSKGKAESFYKQIRI